MMKHLFLASMALLIGSSILTAQAQTASDNSFIQSPVFVPAVDYEAFEKLNNCTEELAREIKYHACRDSRSLYDAALAKAKKAGQPLMVIFGFNRCPYCEVLERSIFNPSTPMRGGHLARYFSKPELKRYMTEKKALTVPVLRLHARSEHGLKLADELAITKMAKDRGWHRVWSPFVVLINPETGAMASHSQWEAKEVYCDWSVNIVTSLENIDFTAKGEPYTERKRCAKS